MIIEISYQEILPIWKHHLWTMRKSPIEPNSAMSFMGGYSMQNMTFQPTFLAYMIDGNIAGVNSGHRCSDDSYRSRGLFTFDQYRNRGVGKSLLEATIEQAKKEDTFLVWSYPRQTSWNVYERAGFSLTSDWHETETGINAYCIFNINKVC